MTARRKTDTHTTTRWVDDCSRCGKEMPTSDPADAAYRARMFGDTEITLCNGCRTQDQVAKETEVWKGIIGARIIGLNFSANTYGAEVDGLRLKLSDGSETWLTPVNGYDGDSASLEFGPVKP